MNVPGLERVNREATYNTGSQCSTPQRMLKVGLAILCPLTSQVKGYPFEVRIPVGLKASGAVLSDQVKRMAWRARKASLLCVVPEPTVREVLNKVGTLLNV
jgi:mRNA interferase MazF